MRNIPAELASEIQSSHIQPAYLVELLFDTGTLRLWTGYGVLKWNGEEFFGGGNLISISDMDETQDIEAKGLVCTLNGIPSNIIALALSERSRGRKFRLYFATVETKSYIATEQDQGRIELEDGEGYILLENQLIAPNPYRLFSGLMDVIEISDNGSDAFVRLNVENNLIVGRRAKVSRYTKEEQRKLYPNDKGLDFINQLQDKEVTW